MFKTPCLSVFPTQRKACLFDKLISGLFLHSFLSVRTHDFDYPESEMDDRESLYFDTISLADSEAAAAAAAHRKSLSQSRNTIYYSAADLAGDETPAKRTNSMRLENGHKGRSSWNPSYRHSSPLDHYLPPNTNGSNSIGGSGNPSLGAVSVAGIAGGNGADYTDAVIAAQVMALQQNGRSNYTAGGASESALHMANDMEVSRRLLQNSAQSSRDKKLPITYSQWKFRVTNFNSLCFFLYPTIKQLRFS